MPLEPVPYRTQARDLGAVSCGRLTLRAAASLTRLRYGIQPIGRREALLLDMQDLCCVFGGPAMFGDILPDSLLVRRPSSPLCLLDRVPCLRSHAAPRSRLAP